MTTPIESLRIGQMVRVVNFAEHYPEPCSIVGLHISSMGENITIQDSSGRFDGFSAKDLEPIEVLPAPSLPD